MTIDYLNVNPRWQLQDVQAALTIVVAVISTIAIFFPVHFLWQRSTAKVRASEVTSLSSLLSVNSIGEVCDVLVLLKLKLLSRKHFRIFIQCILVIIFTLTGLFSGPIARSACRRSVLLTTQNITTWPTARYFDFINFASYDWTNIGRRLDNASFPTNVLLDELPDVDADWKYRPTEWSFTWSLSCTATNSTPLHLITTGICDDLYTEVPGLATALDLTQFDANGSDLRGYWTTASPVYQQLLIFVVGQSITSVNTTTNSATAIDFSVASVHLTNASRPTTLSTSCTFAPVSIISLASFTRIDCSLVRSNDTSNFETSAFPDTTYVQSIAAAYNQMYQARFMREGASNLPITTVEPRDLQHFYQVYMISKDSQWRRNHFRQITANIPVVQISSIFIAAWSLVVALCLVAMVLSVRYRLTYLVAASIPETKIEWMLQSIELPEDEEEPPPLALSGAANACKRAKIAPMKGKIQLASTAYAEGEDYEMQTPRIADEPLAGTNQATSTSFLSAPGLSSPHQTRKVPIAPHSPVLQFENAVFRLDRNHNTRPVSTSTLNRTSASARTTPDVGHRGQTRYSTVSNARLTEVTPSPLTPRDMNAFLDSYTLAHAPSASPQATSRESSWWGQTFSLGGNEIRSPLSAQSATYSSLTVDDEGDVASEIMRRSISNTPEVEESEISNTRGFV